MIQHQVKELTMGTQQTSCLICSGVSSLSDRFPADLARVHNHLSIMGWVWYEECRGGSMWAQFKHFHKQPRWLLLMCPFFVSLIGCMAIQSLSEGILLCACWERPLEIENELRGSRLKPICGLVWRCQARTLHKHIQNKCHHYKSALGWSTSHTESTT